MALPDAAFRDLLEDIVATLPGAPPRPESSHARLLRRVVAPMLALAIVGAAAAAATPARAAAAGTTAAGTTAVQPPPADTTTPASAIAIAVKAQAASCVAPPLAPGARGDAVTYLQLLLNSGGYWQGEVNGSYGELTRQAVMALQASHGQHVDGVMGSATWLALCSSGRPAPRTRSGLVLEVDKRRQILLVARDGKTIWVLHTSTGGNYWYNNDRSFARTPEGHFSVYVRVDGWQYEGLGTLYRPAYVVGGVAVHGGYAVPPYPASHGCIRQTNQAMDMLWAGGYLNIGTNVWIYS
ncbi:MAG: L,D-transpeptidase family protein [Frankiaceae bacterium]